MLSVLAEAALRTLLLGGLVWLGLTLLRVRSPQAQLTAWLVVLAASLAMPLLMHWPTVTLTVPAAPLPDTASAWLPDQPLQETGIGIGAETGMAMPPAAGAETIHAAAPGWFAHLDMLRIATAIYLLVAGALLLRIVTGLILSWRIARAAMRLDEPWVDEPWVDEPRVKESGIGRSDIRLSCDVEGPVTFGSIILLPLESVSWEASRRDAVLAHERAHVRNRDFHMLLLAAINRALFWFSPFAWWQHARLAELAEMISDIHAIEIVEDRLGYAELLLDMVQARQQRMLALQMARASTIHVRIERILATSVLPARIGWRRRAIIGATMLPLVIACAATIAWRTGPAGAVAVATLAAADARKATLKAQHVAFYALTPGAVLSIAREPEGLSGQLTGQRRLPLAATDDGAWSYGSGRLTFALDPDAAQPPELTVQQNGADRTAQRIAALSWDGEACEAMQLDDYLGWYELSPNRVVAVTRDGDRLRLKETGRLGFEIAAECADAFSGKGDRLAIFLRDPARRDASANVTRVLLQDPVVGARVARRVDAARARSIEDASMVRMSETSDHFRAQAPTAGSKELLWRGIIGIQQGLPLNYDKMSPAFAAKAAHLAGETQAMLTAFGAAESIFFRGVGPGGYDVYGVKFAKGFAEFRILLNADGRAEDVFIRPDGNDEPGEILGCASEAGLKLPAELIPIKTMLYNASGSDISLYSLDADGRRVARGTLSDNTTSWQVTDVGRPMVIADRDGQCLEILLPGQRTQYHSLDSVRPGVQIGRPRTAPRPGSEEALRRYIEAVTADQLDELRMTPEVAAFSRQQMAQNRAILAQLGSLRAVSFRGVTGVGSDLYMGHFANGTAEWRIALTSDGAIMRISLGPQ